MAVGVDEDVGGLEVPVDDFCGMQVFHAPEYLVHDEAVVDVLEDLLPDRVVQVRLHVLENEIEVLVVVGADHAVQLYYVLVAQLVQVADLPVGALGVDRVLEGVEYLLQGECCPALPLAHLPHVPVRPRTHLLRQAVASQNVALNLFCHFYISGFKFYPPKPSLLSPPQPHTLLPEAHFQLMHEVRTQSTHWYYFSYPLARVIGLNKIMISPKLLVLD